LSIGSVGLSGPDPTEFVLTVDISTLLLANTSGQSIPSDTFDGTVTVTPPPSSTIAGMVDLQSRDDNSGAQVRARDAGGVPNCDPDPPPGRTSPTLSASGAKACLLRHCLSLQCKILTPLAYQFALLEPRGE
jgi:hypothetical protein